MVGRARAPHVGADVGGEVAAGPGQQRGRKGWGTDRAHMASDSDCFSKATVSTRWWMPDVIRWAATRAVEPPTEPAVWTRNMGLPTAPSASARYSSGIITPSNMSGALPMTTASMSVQVELGVLEGPLGRLAHQPGDGDVVPLGLVLGLAHADDCATLGHHSRLQDADQVLLQARARGGVGHGPMRPRPSDPRGRLADADEAGRHERVGGQGARPTG